MCTNEFNYDFYFILLFFCAQHFLQTLLVFIFSYEVYYFNYWSLYSNIVNFR